MDYAERRKSYVWTILVLSWPAAFFLGFLAMMIGMSWTSSEKSGDDLEKLTLENGTKSEKLISGNVTILKVSNAESICYLTYRRGKFSSSSCVK